MFTETGEPCSNANASLLTKSRTAVGAGRDGSRYLPMTRIEQGVPIVFALAYFTLLIILLVDS